MSKFKIDNKPPGAKASYVLLKIFSQTRITKRNSNQALRNTYHIPIILRALHGRYISICDKALLVEDGYQKSDKWAKYSKHLFYLRSDPSTKK